MSILIGHQSGKTPAPRRPRPVGTSRHRCPRTLATTARTPWGLATTWRRHSLWVRAETEVEGSFLREAPAAPCANFRVERLERRMAKTMQLAVHPRVDVDVGPHVVGALSPSPS